MVEVQMTETNMTEPSKDQAELAERFFEFYDTEKATDDLFFNMSERPISLASDIKISLLF